MLTHKQLQLSFLVYYFFTKIRLYPFILDLKSGQVRIEKARSRWYLWWFLFSLFTCRAILGTLRVLLTLAGPVKPPMEEIPVMLNQLLYWPGVYSLLLMFRQNLDVTLSMFNCLLQKSVRKTTWRNVTLQELLVLLVLPPNIFSIPVVYSVVLVAQPMAVYNFFSALNESWQTTPVLIAIAVTEGILALYVWSHAAFLGHTMVLFFQKCIEETSHTLRRIPTKHSQNPGQSAVTIERALQDMKHLELLIRVYNLGYRKTHFVAKIITMFYYITFTAFGILLIHTAPLIAYAGGFFGIEFAIGYCTIFHKAFAIPMLTKKVKGRLSNFARSNTHGEDRQLFGAYIRSIPPIGIKVGNFHTFERMSTPNFLAFGMKNIIRILIAYRSK